MHISTVMLNFGIERLCEVKPLKALAYLVHSVTSCDLSLVSITQKSTLNRCMVEKKKLVEKTVLSSVNTVQYIKN